MVGEYGPRTSSPSLFRRVTFCQRGMDVFELQNLWIYQMVSAILLYVPILCIGTYNSIALAH